MPWQIGYAIDLKHIEQEVIARATIGLVRAGEHALGRAKQHAPVRELFGKRRRPQERVGRNWATMRSEKRYQAFLAQREKPKRMNIASADTMLAPKMRSEQAGGIIRQSKSMGRIGSFTGKRNSLYPVFSGRDSHGRYRITGDFRNAAGLTASMDRNRGVGQGGLQEAIIQRPGKKAKAIRGNTRSGASRVYRMSQLHEQLSARGRWEIRNAARGGPNSALFNGRIGGRLRGEIRLTPIVWRQGTAWVYVESPTEYARHQEFGTTRHRAQPFLRPALYESRRVLVAEVRRQVGSRKWTVKLPERRGVGAASRRYAADFEDGNYYDMGNVIQPIQSGEAVPTGPQGPGMVPGESAGGSG